MDNPEKLGTQSTQSENKKQTKNKKQNKKQKTQRHNTICVGHHYAKANTNNVYKALSLQQTTGGIQGIVTPTNNWR
jgi:hypothetical protein